MQQWNINSTSGYYEQTLQAKLFGGPALVYDKASNTTTEKVFPALYNKYAHPLDIGQAEFYDDSDFDNDYRNFRKRYSLRTVQVSAFCHGKMTH